MNQHACKKCDKQLKEGDARRLTFDGPLCDKCWDTTEGVSIE